MLIHRLIFVFPFIPQEFTYTTRWCSAESVNRDHRLVSRLCNRDFKWYIPKQIWTCLVTRMSFFKYRPLKGLNKICHYKRDKVLLPHWLRGNNSPSWHKLLLIADRSPLLIVPYQKFKVHDEGYCARSGIKYRFRVSWTFVARAIAELGEIELLKAKK